MVAAVIPAASLLGPKFAGFLGGGAAAAWAISQLIKGPVTGFIQTPMLREPKVSVPASDTLKKMAKGTLAKWKRIRNALGRQLIDTFTDLVGETVKDAVLFPGATMLLSDAITYWIYTDLVTKSTFDSTLNIPTSETFSSAVNSILDTIAALLATDIISNRDVGSDVAESIIDSFSDSIVGDAIRAYLDTIAGVEAVDDDEIRDIVGEGAVATADEMAYIGARSGLDTFSAISELYTGLLQGDNPYWNRAVREIEDNLKRLEKGLAADLHIYGALVERLGEDLIDSVYWYLEAVDYIINRIKTILRDVGQVQASLNAGTVDHSTAQQIFQGYMAEIQAYRVIVEALGSPDIINEITSKVVDSYKDFISKVDLEHVKSKIEKILDDVGLRIAEHINTAKDAYIKLNWLRQIKVKTE